MTIHKLTIRNIWAKITKRRKNCPKRFPWSCAITNPGSTTWSSLQVPCNQEWSQKLTLKRYSSWALLSNSCTGCLFRVRQAKKIATCRSPKLSSDKNSLKTTQHSLHFASTLKDHKLMAQPFCPSKRELLRVWKLSRQFWSSISGQECHQLGTVCLLQLKLRWCTRVAPTKPQCTSCLPFCQISTCWRSLRTRVILIGKFLRGPFATSWPLLEILELKIVPHYEIRCSTRTSWRVTMISSCIEESRSKQNLSRENSQKY